MTNRKALKSLINWVDMRNRSMLSSNLLGISIDKFFMPSFANIIGTDLSTYKLIMKNQFACNPMHVGRDEKMPIALYREDTPSIVSPAYFVFEVKNTLELLPEYLMLWFRRAEFDRECWFHTDGSVRGGITWEEILDMTIPVPSIDEQNQIVQQYNDINDRIRIKREVNDNLVASAQVTLLKLFSDNTDIPKQKIADFCFEIKAGGTPNRTMSIYWDNGQYPWVKNGEVKMTEADCPDHLCMKQKAVDNTGGTIVCLPNKVVIEGEKGLFIAMPSRKASDGEYRDIAHPINSDTRDIIQKSILQEYEAIMASGEEETVGEAEVAL